MANEIWIIGVDPPCPRCDLTRQRVERLVEEMGLPIKVRHLVYNDPESLQFADSIGRELGTAMDVAVKARINMDTQNVPKENKYEQILPEDFGNIDGPARRWSPEMDEKLRPFQMKASSFGMLMSPTLVIHKEEAHHGSVPSIEQIRSWLS